MRRPKTTRVPRTRAGNTWTEAAFWGFIRSALRAMLLKWPPRANALRNRRRPNQSNNKRLKWESQCENCGEWFKAADVEIDHIVPCGQLKRYEDLPGFVERLLCEEDGFQILCKANCHKRKTHSKPQEEAAATVREQLPKECPF